MHLGTPETPFASAFPCDALSKNMLLGDILLLEFARQGLALFLPAQPSIAIISRRLDGVNRSAS